jgi:hypothetical protein
MASATRSERATIPTVSENNVEIVVEDVKPSLQTPRSQLAAKTVQTNEVTPLGLTVGASGTNTGLSGSLDIVYDASKVPRSPS